MATEIRVPPLGESVVEASVGTWRKQEGDLVEVGDVLVELETEKVNVEVPAPGPGRLAAIVHSTGETVSVGDVLGVVEAVALSPPGPQAGPAPGSVTPSESHLPLSAVPAGQGGRVRAAEAAAFLPRMEDVRRGAEGVLPHTATEERRRLSRRRLTIARRLVEAQQTAAMVTTFNQIDMSAYLSLRSRRQEAFIKEFGVTLGLMSVFVKATVAALAAFPILNAEIRGEEVVYKRHYDIGVAVATDEGLVVPVVRGADRLSFAGIERTIAELASRANAMTLTREDLEGATFSITNGGVFGSMLSTPFLNPPQVGILGMHAIAHRPVAVDGAVALRPMMYVALTYDHRLVDGREAVQFLVRIKELIEDPERLLFAG